MSRVQRRGYYSPANEQANVGEYRILSRPKRTERVEEFNNSSRYSREQIDYLQNNSGNESNSEFDNCPVAYQERPRRSEQSKKPFGKSEFEPTKPYNLVKPIRSTKQYKPAKPIKPAKPAKPVKPTNSDKQSFESFTRPYRSTREMHSVNRSQARNNYLPEEIPQVSEIPKSEISGLLTMINTLSETNSKLVDTIGRLQQERDYWKHIASTGKSSSVNSDELQNILDSNVPDELVWGTQPSESYPENSEELENSEEIGDSEEPGNSEVEE